MTDADDGPPRRQRIYMGVDHVLSKAELTSEPTEISPAVPASDTAPPPDLPLAGGAWLAIMALLDALLLGPALLPLGLRLLGLGLLGWWWWGGGRSPRWLPGVWFGITVAGQVAATYFWAEAGVGATALAGGTLAGFLLLPLAAPLLRDLTRPPPPDTAAAPAGGVPLPVLRLAADSLNSRLQTMGQELDGLNAGPISPAQAIQLRLLRNEVAGMQALVRQRLGGNVGDDAMTPPPRVPPPPAPAPAPAVAPAPGATRPASLVPNGLSALVVDDDPVGRTLTRLLLEQAGYWVEDTDDARMALEMALMEGPDVALIAARIGQNSGIALSWCIRRGGGPPVVLMRGRADRVTDRQRQRAGLAAILGKPVTPDNLAATLTPLLADRTPAVPAPGRSPAPPSAPPQPAMPQQQPDMVRVLDLRVLDLRVLEEHLSILGAARVAQIIDSFSRNAPVTLYTLADATAQGDVPAVGRAAHKLASGALTVGLSVLADLAKTADTAAKQGETERALTAARQMPAAFAAGQAALAGYRRNRLSPDSAP